MKKQGAIRTKTLFRAIIALSMLIIWIFVVLTGILLWLAPHGQGAGQLDFIAGLTRHEIGDIHFYISLAAVALTIAHVFVDWKAFMGLMRYMVNTRHRSHFEKLSES